MRKTLFGLMAIIAIAACNYGCSGNSQKLAEKEKELEELRQLAELDKRPICRICCPVWRNEAQH